MPTVAACDGVGCSGGTLLLCQEMPEHPQKSSTADIRIGQGSRGDTPLLLVSPLPRSDRTSVLFPFLSFLIGGR